MELLLALIVLSPLAGSVGVWILGELAPNRIREFTLGVVALTFLLTVPVVLNPSDESQLSWTWVEHPEIRFALGIDGLSVWLVGLTSLLTLSCVLVSWESIRQYSRAFFSLLLVLESAMLGTFMAKDVLLFYIFFEFTLIPLLLLIGIWGGSERKLAARKFFIYTLSGSVLTFLGLIYLVLANSEYGSGELTFSIPKIIEHLQLPSLDESSVQIWVFLALFMGFAIKVPLFPFHTWLPLAHVQAPTAGSILLAGVLLKIGTYGFIRFSIPLLPDATRYFMPAIMVLSIIAIVYGALVALAQNDIKRLVAYSSVSHMGFCMLGIFTLNRVGISGGILQMISHGLATGALFALVGMVYDRYHTRQIEDFSGLAHRMPVMSFFFVLMALSSLGLPGLAGFVGEIMILMGAFQNHPFYAACAAIGIVLGAWYTLWLVERILFGPLHEPIQSSSGTDSSPAITDMTPREIAAIGPLAILIIWIGIAPQMFLQPIHSEIDRLVDYPDQMVTATTSISSSATQTKHSDFNTRSRDSNPAVITQPHSARRSSWEKKP